MLKITTSGDECMRDEIFEKGKEYNLQITLNKFSPS